MRRSSEETDSPVTMKTAALNAGPRARSPRERHARGHPHPGIRAPGPRQGNEDILPCRAKPKCGEETACRRRNPERGKTRLNLVVWI